jgi:predicted Zn-dependent peptidase
MVLRLEDSEEYAHMLGKYELLHKDPKTPEEFMREIDKVTVKDVLRVTADLFKAERLRLAVIGPFDDSWKFEELLKM